MSSLIFALVSDQVPSITFGTARMIQTRAEGIFNLHPFPDATAAIKWLGLDPKDILPILEDAREKKRAIDLKKPTS